MSSRMHKMTGNEGDILDDYREIPVLGLLLQFLVF